MKILYEEVGTDKSKDCLKFSHVFIYQENVLLFEV